jgi:hypothetical protein
MIRAISTAVASVVLVAVAPIAHASTIYFGNLANGTPVTNQYPGVVFSLMGEPDSDGPPTINTFSAGTGLANSTNPDYPTANILDMAFTSSVTGVSFTFDNYASPGQTGAPTTYTAFNSSGGIVSTGSLQNVNGSFQLITVTGSGITDLQLNNNDGDNSWYFAIQQLSFSASTSVPEPGSMALAGAALIGLAAVWRRKRKAA